MSDRALYPHEYENASQNRVAQRSTCCRAECGEYQSNYNNHPEPKLYKLGFPGAVIYSCLDWQYIIFDVRNLKTMPLGYSSLKKIELNLPKGIKRILPTSQKDKIFDSINKTIRELRNLFWRRFGNYSKSSQTSRDRLMSVLFYCTWLMFEQSSHRPHAEETEHYLKVLNDFLTEIEGLLKS